MINLPVVMPANLRKMAVGLNQRFPGRVGLLLGPTGYIHPRNVPFALDNDRFSCWSKGKDWSVGGYLEFLDKFKKENLTPLWALVPDVVADAAETFSWYNRWSKVLLRYDWPLALAVQDGMTVEQVKKIRPKPDVIFVGGSTKWKWHTAKLWCRNFPRVHVGRVNTRRLLWSVHNLGAESSDGTGWWHKKQYRQLVNYLELTSASDYRDEGHGFFDLRSIR